MLLRKAHTSAVALIPPAELWPPINQLRRGRDRRFRRWMPHITLLFPFVDQRLIAQVRPRLEAAAAHIQPFTLQLAQFAHFSHANGTATLYLVPEPSLPLQLLHRALARELPEFDDSSRFAHGFTPHLTIGQAPDSNAAANTLAQFRADWQPLHWPVRALQVVRRNDPPDDVMRLGYDVPLGAA